MSSGEGTVLDNVTELVRARLGSAKEFGYSLKDWSPSESLTEQLENVDTCINVGYVFNILGNAALPDGVCVVTDVGLYIQQVNSGETKHVAASFFKEIVSGPIKTGIFRAVTYAIQIQVWEPPQGSVFLFGGTADETAKLSDDLKGIPGFGIKPEPEEKTPLFLRLADLGSKRAYHPALESMFPNPTEIIAFVTDLSHHLVLLPDRVVQVDVANSVPGSSKSIDTRQILKASRSRTEGRVYLHVAYTEGSKKKNLLQSGPAEGHKAFHEELRGLQASIEVELASELPPFETTVFERYQNLSLAKQAGAAFQRLGLGPEKVIEVVADSTRMIILTDDNLVHFENRILSSKPPTLERISFRQLLDVQAFKDGKWVVSITMPPSSTLTPILAVDFGNVTMAQAKAPENRILKVAAKNEAHAKAFRDSLLALLNPQAPSHNEQVDVLGEVKKLKELFDAGALTEQEFNKSKVTLLKKLG